MKWDEWFKSRSRLFLNPTALFPSSSRTSIGSSNNRAFLHCSCQGWRLPSSLDRVVAAEKNIPPAVSFLGFPWTSDHQKFFYRLFSWSPVSRFSSFCCYVSIGRRLGKNRVYMLCVSSLFSVVYPCRYVAVTVVFRFVFRSSGGFRPPPATLAMVAGGGGRILDHMLLLDLNFATRGLYILLFHVNRWSMKAYRFPAKQPLPATVTMVAGGGGLILYLLMC